MKGIDRTRRIGEQIRRDLAKAAGEILDHHQATMLSFTAVRVSRDLSRASVYVTHVLDDPGERKALVEALDAHAGRFRHYLAKHLSTRTVPELRFCYDRSVQDGARMHALLDTLVKDLPADDVTAER